MKFYSRPLAFVLVLSTLPAFGNPGRDAPRPHTDPNNAGGWVLNQSVSDEFNGISLDQSKWHVQGTGGLYNNNFLGRAPSQFTPNNYRIGDGTLKIVTKWEPDFDFSDKVKDGHKYENITTAAVITKAEIKYGYLEIRCKAADGPISSAFWAIGKSGELDVFEHWGQSTRNPESERRYHTSLHDWRDPKSPTWAQRVWTNDHLLDFRVAEDFHVYGLEWDPQYIRIFVDGKLIRHVTKQEIGDAWVADNDMKVWLDCEIFPWEAKPTELSAADYPGDGLEFVVDYVRIWQKPPRSRASPDPALENLVSGDHGWELSGGARAAKGQGRSGNHAVGLDGSGKISRQVVVKPNTTYVLSAWAKMPNTNGKDVWENAWLGVEGYGGETIRKKFFRADYYRGSLQFTTDSQIETVNVFFTNDQTGHDALVKDFKLYEAPDLSAP